MDNKHYMLYDLDENKLDLLTENELMVQIRLIAHVLDKQIQFSQTRKTSFTENELKKLTVRLDVYENKFDIKKPDYAWAVKVKELYIKGIAEQQNFVYPWENKVNLNIHKEEFEKLILGRRSIRCFIEGEIPDEVIKEVIKYGSWAPNTCNMQALRYVVIRNPEIKQRVNDGGFTGKMGNYIIAVIADYKFYDDWNIDGLIHDSAASIQNMLITCHYFGIGACYISDQGVNLDKYREILKIKESEKVTAFIWLGIYDKVPIAPARRNLDDIIEII